VNFVNKVRDYGEIAEIMGFKNGENARRITAHIDFKINHKKSLSNELKL